MKTNYRMVSEMFGDPLETLQTHFTQTRAQAPPWGRTLLGVQLYSPGRQTEERGPTRQANLSQAPHASDPGGL